jgi:hypothetical protein
MAAVVEMTKVFGDFTLLSVLCCFWHHTGITAFTFQISELGLEDDVALGQKDVIYMGWFQGNMAKHSHGKARTGM